MAAVSPTTGESESPRPLPRSRSSSPKRKSKANSATIRMAKFTACTTLGVQRGARRKLRHPDRRTVRLRFSLGGAAAASREWSRGLRLTGGRGYRRHPLCLRDFPLLYARVERPRAGDARPVPRRYGI